MTVRSTIEAQLPELSTSARRIARHICERYPVSALGGIEDIARQAQVSPPTVTRFVRRLGFERFADFQRAIRLEVQDADASPLALMQRHRSAPPPVGKAAQSALIANLAASVSALDTAATATALDAAQALIAERRHRISAIGGRWSSIAAQYLAFQLSSLRGEVHVITQPASGVREDRIADFTRRDVLVAYDFRRYQPETIAFCEAARSRGVRIVLITDPDLSPVADIAEVTIAVAVATTSPLDTLVPALAASDMLLARLVDTLGEEATRRMAMLETLRRRACDPTSRT